MTFRNSIVLLAVCILGACTQLRGDVTVFHNVTPDVYGRTVAVKGYPEKIDASIEFATYRRMIENQLRANGFKIENDPTAADYIAFTTYGLDITTEQRIGSTPEYGQTGGGTAYHSGIVSGYGGSAFYSGTSYTMPTYGVVGSSSYSYSSTTNTRALSIDIVETATINQNRPSKIFEGKITSVGRCSKLNQVMDLLVEGLFQNFPGTSGKTRSVVVSHEEQRCGF
jgi:hypothetical protein